MKWSSRPFVRIFLFYVIGILAVYHIPMFKTVSPLVVLILLGIFFILSGVIYVLRIPWKWTGISGLSIGAMVFLLGVLMTVKHEIGIKQPLPEGRQLFYAEVIKEPSKTKNSIKTILRVTKNPDSLSVYAAQNVMAYLFPDSSSHKLVYGDQLLFMGEVKSHNRPANPGEFDYRSYLLRNDIIGMTYIASDKWQLLGHQESFNIYSIANRIRKYLIGALEQNGLSGRNHAVASAVILGYDKLMDTELEQDYVGAGAMHILCVSGLHVGIVYLALNFMLSFLKRNKFQIWLKAFLLLLMVWMYALLTGLSPSVIRASIMLSLFIIGNAISRGRDPYNTLAASAMIMLIYDPMLLFNLGFQLSYSAVLGILTFYKPIYSELYIKNLFIDKIWSIVVVSVSAQLGTFPLAAHYFHFFPTYFWVTNILIFPLSFIIIGLGMAFIVIAWIPVIPKLIGAALSFSVYLMNESVGLVNQLPGHGIEGLYFPWLKVILVYGLIIFVFQWIIHGKIKYLMPTLLVLLLLVSVQTFIDYKRLNRTQFVIYSVNKHTAMDFISGNDHLCLMDSILFSDQFKQDYHLKNAHIEWGLNASNAYLTQNTSNKDLGFYYDGEFGKFGDFNFLRLDEQSDYYSASQLDVNLNALIFSGRKRVDFETITKCFEFDLVILDSSVPYWKRKKIKEWANMLGIQLFDVSESGVWLRNIKTSRN